MKNKLKVGDWIEPDKYSLLEITDVEKEGIKGLSLNGKKVWIGSQSLGFSSLKRWVPYPDEYCIFYNETIKYFMVSKLKTTIELTGDVFYIDVTERTWMNCRPATEEVKNLAEGNV